MTAPLSLAAYARRRGVSTVAVSKAIAAGRLADSVTRDARGAPKIADPDLADREWTANTRPSVNAPPSHAFVHRPGCRCGELNECTCGLTCYCARWTAPPAPVPVAAPLARRDVPDYNESRARREAALADMAELEVAERRGELVPVAEARADVVARFTLVRTRLLGVPARAAQRLPHLAGEVVPVVDALVREALEELALDGDPE